MAGTFQIIALSSLDPDGRNNRDEPELSFPDALATAKSLVSQGKAFRVLATGKHTDDDLKAFLDLGALYDRKDALQEAAAAVPKDFVSDGNEC